MKSLPIFSAMMLLAATCTSADEVVPGFSPSPAMLASIKSKNQEIVASAKNAVGVFEVQDNGDIKHLQSGMVCPAFFANLNFYNVLLFPGEPGSDIGCDYRRADDLGGAGAKLTLYAARLGSGVTLDAAFAGYRNELLTVWPSAKSLGAAMHFQRRAASDPEVRSEEFSVLLNQQEYTTQLVVELRTGWIIVVRATFAGKSNAIFVKKGYTNADLANLVADRAMDALALVAVEKSLNGQPASIPAQP